MEWRFFHRRSGKTLFAADSQPRLRLPGGECFIPEAHRAFFALLDEASYTDSPFKSGIRVGIDRVYPPGESPNTGLYSPVRQGDVSDRQQSFQRRASSRTGSSAF